VDVINRPGNDFTVEQEEFMRGTGPPRQQWQNLSIRAGSNFIHKHRLGSRIFDLIREMRRKSINQIKIDSDTDDGLWWDHVTSSLHDFLNVDQQI
jgi:hypothetical protein